MELSRLDADGLGGAVLHGDALAGVNDLDGQLAIAFVLFQFPADHILLAHQNHLDAQTPGGSNRPFDFGFRGVVSAHCIHAQWSACRGGATPARLRPLRGPCTGRSAGKRGGAAWARGNWDTPKDRTPSAHRARGACSVRFLECLRLGFGISLPQQISSAIALLQGSEYSEFQIAERAPAIVRVSSLQSHAVSFRFLPQTGQIPLQASLHTRCIGKASSTCSRRMSSSSMPPSS